MVIRYNQEIKVSRRQYEAALKELEGLIAHRQSWDGYFIKVWNMRYKDRVKQLLTVKQ